MMVTLWQDLRYGARMLLKNPGFTFVAVFALALGIGANTAIFSVVNGVLLRPLPFAEPDRLVKVKSTNVTTSIDGQQFGGVSPADFFDWQQQNSSFESVTAYSGTSVVLTDAGQPEMLPGTRVSGRFFDVFAARPMLGRTFIPDEFRSGGGKAIMISYRLWQRRFGGDARIVGQSFPISGQSTTIVGVMPPEFKEPAQVEVWTPLAEDSSEMQLRGNRYYSVVGRLKSDVGIEQAQAEMNTVAARLSEQYPKSNAGWNVTLTPLREAVVGEFRPALLILLGAVVFVLAIACANVANLLLARASTRHKEMAIRTALGATRWRVMRQLLVESVLLAFLGGALGVLLAVWGVDAIKALIPEAMRFPRLDEVRIDAAVLGFTIGVSLLTGVLFGLLPGWQASKPDLNESLKETGRSSTASSRLQRTRGLLVVIEVALSLVLLVGAGLLIKSLSQLQRTQPGYNTKNLVTFSVGVPKKYPPLSEGSAVFYQQLQERIGNITGVAGVATTSGAPLTGFILSFPFTVEGRTPNSEDNKQATYSSVSPNYFDVMEIKLRAGRRFNERDVKGTPKVAVISETMVRRFFPGQDPLGKRLVIDYLNVPTTLEVVGVAADIKQSKLEETPDVEIYVSANQLPWFSTALVVRTVADPSGVTNALQKAVWSLNPDQPLSFKTMDQLLSESVAQSRLYTLLLGVFSMVALVLAGVGIYGVISYSVAQRTHEIGVRLALGAQPQDILRLVIGRGLALTLAGVLLGLVVSVAMTRVLSSLLYEVSATDPTVFAAIALLLVAVALVACYIPARRALRVDPMLALRYE